MNRLEILLIEDNLADVRIAEEAFKENGVLAKVSYVSDGVEAISYLKKEGAHIDKSTPNLIFLDLNLPKLNGFEVLSLIKSNDTLKQIPIVIFTTSQSDEDVARCYKLGANSFITKPIDLDSFIDAIQTVSKYWLQLVKLPK